MLLIAGTLGWVLHILAAKISGEPDFSFAHPALFRATLAAAVSSAGLLVARFAGFRLAVIAFWTWIALLALATAFFLTGLSPYFLFPALIGAPVIAAYSFWGGPWRSVLASVVVAAVALPLLVLWISLAVAGETVQGLAVHPLFTVPAAVALASLIPLIRVEDVSARLWGSATIAALVVAVALSVAGALRPAYTAIMPQRLSIQYIEDNVRHRTLWAADANAPLPPSLKDAAAFSSEPEKPAPFAFQKSYVATAGTPRLAPPTASVSTVKTGDGEKITLMLHGSADANQMILAIPRDASVKEIEILGKHFEVPKEWASSPLGDNIVGCFTPDCASATVELTLASAKPVKLQLAEVRYGLPKDAAKLIAARPANAIPSQNGDTTVLLNAIEVR
jgi:hypothetical protein